MDCADLLQQMVTLLQTIANQNGEIIANQVKLETEMKKITDML